MLRVSPTGTKSWYVQIDRNHKRKIADASLLTASVARYRAKDILVRQAVASGRPLGRAGERTLGEYLLGRYLEFSKQRSQYRERDVRRLVSALGNLKEERLEHIGRSRLERWKLNRSGQVRPTTLNRELSMLRTALDQAVKWRLLADNPARKLRLMKHRQSRKPRTLNPVERDRLNDLLSKRNDRISTMAQLALNTGLRRNELFGLRWKDVYLGPNPSVIIEKSGRQRQNRSRRIPLNVTATNALERWQSLRYKRAYLVFPSPSGGRLKNVATAWKRLMNEAQIRNFTLNDCRDDFAVRLVGAGVPLTQVRDLLGHSSIVLTERYALPAPDQLSGAVTLLDRR